MKAAVIYYSLEGNTKLAAEKIAEITGADLIRLKPVKEYPDKGIGKFFWGGKSSTFKEKPELEKYDFDAEKYDTVILGSPVWAGNIAPPLRTFLSENDLSGKRAAAVICCSGGSPRKSFDTIIAEAKQASLIAELNLIDPLKKGGEHSKAIEDFCKKITE